ncbi:hypothetical protein PIB30_059011 [Stylosanthes scabra]|uniref:Uncharacterized protein n=1 Tax=Stylosanthes scabra TaxID=79078 RepID=A0ABU6ZIT2_9FABA|nr:hypothetical protein [Stylosanthes scabra]
MVFSLDTILSFHGSLPDSIREQNGSVLEYYDKFMAYVQSIQVSDPELLVSCFIYGLQIQIHGEVLRKKPKTMIQAWFSARLCELNLEEDKQLDPEIQATSDQEITTNSTQFHQIQEITEHKITTYSDIEAFLDSEFQLFNNLSTNTKNETPDLVPTFLDGGTSSLDGNNGGTRSPICTIGADIKTLASNNAEDGAVAKGKVMDANAEPVLHFAKEETGNQPTPKPPDLPSHAGVLDGAEDNADLNCSSGVGVVDDEAESNVEVSASANEKWRTIVAGVDATMRGGGLQSQGLYRISLIVAKPPLLLAAVLPWDRAEAARTTKATVEAVRSSTVVADARGELVLVSLLEVVCDGEKLTLNLELDHYRLLQAQRKFQQYGMEAKPDYIDSKPDSPCIPTAHIPIINTCPHHSYAN